MSLISTAAPLDFVTLGMFIIDGFSYLDEDGQPSGRSLEEQESLIGGGGTYAAIGARIWLSAERLGMIVDKGHDFPPKFQAELETFGPQMWMMRDQGSRSTTRALNTYQCQHRSFKYLTQRIRISPDDLEGTRLARPKMLHFICSPSRALEIISQVGEVVDWNPTTIFEPIPDRCVPKELPALVQVLPSISILSPNAEEALSFFSESLPPTKKVIEEVAAKFMAFGIGKDGGGCVIIRCGELGAYTLTRQKGGQWYDAFWNNAADDHRVVDVTGAGNGFLGGFAAGLVLGQNDVYEATLYGLVSASFIIEQTGLPSLSVHLSGGDAVERWNGDVPKQRLEKLRMRSVSY